MRTTIDIDDDLLAATRELARREGSTAGRVVSRLLRQTLTGGASTVRSSPKRRPNVAGFEPFAARSGVVTTNEQVNLLRDAEAI